MTSSIIVFQPPDVKEVSISKTEQEILYDKFEKQASIPAYHFNSFMEMENKKKQQDDVKTTLPSIMIKKILAYCQPILKEIPDFTVKTKTVDVFKKPVAEERQTAYYNISLQLDYPIVCKVEGIKNITTIVIPPDTMFFITGVHVPQKFKKIIDSSSINYIMSLKQMELFSSGKYGLTEFQSDTYTQSYIDTLIPKGKAPTNIYFTSDDDSKKKIMEINRYIKYIETFYEKNYYMVNLYLQQPPFINYIKEYIKAYYIFYPEPKSLKLFPTEIKSKRLQPTEINSVFDVNTTVTPIVKIMEHLIHSKSSGNAYADNFLFSISNVFEIYNKIQMLGINNPQSKKLIKLISVQNQYDKILIDYNKLKFSKKLEFAKKKSIAINKFNIYNLLLLTPAQYKIVNLEYDKLEKYYKSFQKYTDDFNVINSLDWAMTNDKQKLIHERLKEIDKVIKIPKDLDNSSEMLQNAHKVNLICPHVIAKAQKMIATYKSDLIKSGQIREYLINTFSLPPTDEGYFCRICGELLTEADEEEVSKYVFGKRVSFVTEIDPLKQQIWKDIAQIMTSFVKFKDAVNIKPIVNLMTDSLRPELGTIEANLIKIKSNTKDSIKNLMSIYTSIYTFAMVVHMINNNYGKITFAIRPGKSGGGKKEKKNSNEKSKKHSNKKSKKHSPLIEYDVVETELSEFKSDILEDNDKDISHANNITGGKQDPKNQERLQNIINNALYLILKTKNIALNNVTSISTYSVKPILIKAYKWAADLKNTDSSLGIESGKDIPKEDQMKLNNHIYYYLVYAHNMYNAYNNPTNIKLDNKKIHTKTILGRDWNTIEADIKDNKSIYETAVIPGLWNDRLVKSSDPLKSKILEATVADRLVKSSDPLKSKILEATVELSKYKYESFKSMMEYVKQKLYNQNVVPLSSLIKEHTDKYAYLKTMEYKFFDAQKIEKLRPFNNIILNENLEISMNDFRPSNIKIEKFYDNNGILHNFNIYVFQHANNKGILSGPKKEYTKKDILALLSSKDDKKLKEFKYMFIVDEKCSVCDVLFSKVKNTGINKALEKISNIQTFFLFYENRCPKGELHDFVVNVDSKKENSCKKCGITKNIVDMTDKCYYDKYIKIYEKIQAEKIELEKNNIKELSDTKVEKVVKKSFPVWKINNSSILELSRTFKIKYNILINLGLSNGIKYKLIEDEKINPSSFVTPAQSTIRNVYLYGYYLSVVRMYYLIKNYEVITNIPFDIKELMSKNKVRELNKKLPDLDSDILLQYDYYITHESTSNISNFLLYSISNILLNIYTNMKKAQINIATELVMLIINSIINAEKIISEPDIAKFVIPGAKSDDMDRYESLEIENAAESSYDGYASASESEGALEDLGDDEPDDQFDTGDLDMDQDAEENFEMHHDII